MTAFATWGGISGGTSGNLIADRRYARGEGAAREGDYAAAVDLFAQTLELAPAWAPAWFALGDAREKLGEREAAIVAFARAAALDPDGGLGASLRLAALGAGVAPPCAPEAYVRALFDQYAARFDTHLVEALAYRGPQLLRAAIDRASEAYAPDSRDGQYLFYTALDLGCGTGLMGKALGGHVDSMAGVDLSPLMIEAARATGAYDQLVIGDIVAFLRERHGPSCDLIVAADVFVYIGDLDAIFAQCARVLEAGGLFAFSVQCGEGGWALGADLRYTHSPAYVRALASEHGFEIVSLEEASTRKDAGHDVPGLVCVLARA